jgi:hypothetical protein
MKMPIKILPYIEKIRPKEDTKQPFVSQIEKPKPKQTNKENRIFFIK